MKRIILLLLLFSVALIAMSSVSASSDAGLDINHDGRHIHSGPGLEPFNPVVPFNPRPFYPIIGPEPFEPSYPYPDSEVLQ